MNQSALTQKGFNRFISSKWIDSVEISTLVEMAIMRGLMFTNHGIMNMTAGQTLYFGGKTPADLDVLIFLPQVISNQPNFEMYAYENSEFSGGTPTTLINLNRQSDNTHKWTNNGYGLTVTNEGTQFYSSYIAGVESIVPANIQGGTTIERKFYVLKRNTNYLLKFINNEDANKLFFLIEDIECILC